MNQVDVLIILHCRVLISFPLNRFIDGQWYDLSAFVPAHPGGDVISHYHGKDATDVFHAFHSTETKANLSARKKVTPAPAVPKANTNATAKAFRELRERVEKEGWLETSLAWYAYKTGTTFLFLAAGLWLLKAGYPMVAAVSLGIYWQQMGWLSHEYCHHQVFKDRRLNNMVGLVFGNFFQGFSATWWKDRHNSHHASTNIVDVDPDLDNLPLMIWTKKDLGRLEGMPFAQKMIRYQVYYFWFVLALLRMVWMLQSYLFVRTMKDCSNSVWRSLAKAESIAINGHYVFQAYLLWHVPISLWIPFIFVSNCIAGFGIGIVVFFNHYAAHHFSVAKAADEDFFVLQMRTTRNMSPGVLTDWICGGLNYQIEHHLFPTMPRHRLLAFSKLVKEVARKHKIEYMCEDFVPGVTMACQQLNKMSRHVADHYSHAKTN
jgi:fatty acid desaturase